HRLPKPSFGPAHCPARRDHSTPRGQPPNYSHHPPPETPAIPAESNRTMLTDPTVTSITVDPPLSPHELQSVSRTPHRELPTSNATRTRPHTAFADTSHSYVTHLIEFGYPERFVTEQVGHSYA